MSKSEKLKKTNEHLKGKLRVEYLEIKFSKYVFQSMIIWFFFIIRTFWEIKLYFFLDVKCWNFLLTIWNTYLEENIYNAIIIFMIYYKSEDMGIWKRG